MPEVKPFKGVRANTNMASHVISRTYQDYSKEELESLLRYNPFSFLHILNPGYKYSHTLSGNERFTLVRNRYLEFREEGYLIQDDQPAFYIYERQDEENSYTGIIAATRTEDYHNGTIKKHEDTILAREQLFKDYLKTVGFNAEPVLLTYPNKSSIDDIIASQKKHQPDYDFFTTDRSKHKIWVVQDPKTLTNLQKAFQQMDHLYIADGHHRSASSLLLSQQEDSNHDSYRYFMSYLIPENQLKIQEFNRLVTDLNGLSKEDFLMRLDMHFRIQNRGSELYKPSKKNHFSMYLDGEYYSLYLRKSHQDLSNPLAHLDTQILYELVLKPILGIKDLRNDSRIAYSYGASDLLNIKNKIDKGLFKVGFGMIPVTVDQLKQIADAGQVMPPKSTYILPKLPSGLIIYEFES